MTRTDPIAQAALLAIDELQTLLGHARTHLKAGETLAAIGALVTFDERADDMRAALRLLRSARRRRP